MDPAIGGRSVSAESRTGLILARGESRAWSANPAGAIGSYRFLIESLSTYPLASSSDVWLAGRAHVEEGLGDSMRRRRSPVYAAAGLLLVALAVAPASGAQAEDMPPDAVTAAPAKAGSTEGQGVRADAV
jgi:hypothetical protein